jgi:hypothetical protein
MPPPAGPYRPKGPGSAIWVGPQEPPRSMIIGCMTSGTPSPLGWRWLAYLLTVKELGGWKSLTMVQRYAHLSPSHRRAAIERLAVRRPEAREVAGTGTE